MTGLSDVAELLLAAVELDDQVSAALLAGERVPVEIVLAATSHLIGAALAVAQRHVRVEPGR